MIGARLPRSWRFGSNFRWFDQPRSERHQANPTHPYLGPTTMMDRRSKASAGRSLAAAAAIIVLLSADVRPAASQTTATSTTGAPDSDSPPPGGFVLQELATSMNNSECDRWKLAMHRPCARPPLQRNGRWQPLPVYVPCPAHQLDVTIAINLCNVTGIGMPVTSDGPLRITCNTPVGIPGGWDRWIGHGRGWIAMASASAS